MNKSVRDEYAKKTRADILLNARYVFTQTAFASSSLQQIAEAAGVTRGALYHHFKNKEDIFLAVFRELQSEMVQHLGHQIAQEEQTEPWDLVKTILSEFLEYSQNPVYRKIVLIEGPVALGWLQWRKVEEEYAFNFIGSLVDTLAAQGTLIEANRDAVITMIFGLTVESSMALAKSEDRFSSADIKILMEKMLMSFKVE